MVDSVSGEVVENEEQVKGYAVGKDQYVTVEDDELANIAIESTHGRDREVRAQGSIDGLISVAQNTSTDLIVTCWVARARARFAQRPTLITRERQASSALMCGLGVYVLFMRRGS
jgi:hypothetical protein